MNTVLNFLTLLCAISKCIGRSMAEILGSGLLHMALMGDDNLMYVPASWDLRDLELHLLRLGLQRGRKSS